MAVARHMYRLDTEIELLGYKQRRGVVLDNHYELIISLKGACDEGAIARKYFNIHVMASQVCCVCTHSYTNSFIQRMRPSQ